MRSDKSRIRYSRSGHALVKRRVFDSAANVVMRIGPKMGWKLDACAKLKDVFPNQICTISHAIELSVHFACPLVGGVSDAMPCR